MFLFIVAFSVFCFWKDYKLYYKSDNYNICPSVVSIVSPEIPTLGNTTTSWIIESVVPLGNDCNYSIHIIPYNDEGANNSVGIFSIR